MIEYRLKETKGHQVILWLHMCLSERQFLLLPIFQFYMVPVHSKELVVEVCDFQVVPIMEKVVWMFNWCFIEVLKKKKVI